MTDFISALKELSCDVEIKENESLSLHSTFKIGGPARYFSLPATEEQFISVMRAVKTSGERYIIIGNGSNILFSDRGFDGVVISTCSMKDVSADGSKITALCGSSVIRTAMEAQKRGLSGLEFAYGIPGTCGGAVFMNAGAYGGEVKDVISEITYLTPDLQLKTMPVEEAKLSYRHSVFKENGCVVVSAKFKMKKAPKEEIKAAMNDYLSRRKDKQPLEYPSAGSTFKRPEGYFAGALIEQCGFKGKSLGGAQISDKHAGFLINKDNATAKDILNLITLTQETVKTETGVTLEPEVIILR